MAKQAAKRRPARWLGWAVPLVAAAVFGLWMKTANEPTPTQATGLAEAAQTGARPATALAAAPTSAY